METKILKENINYEEWVSLKVIKHSKKPFKNGNQIAIATKLTINPHSNKQGFEIDGDENNIVDCRTVKLYENK